MSLYKQYNPNPARNCVGDCTVRDICKDRVFAALSAYGLAHKDMPSANNVWSKYLRELGFRRYLIDDDKDDYTVEGFCRDHPQGTYILVIDGYVVCAVDVFYYDFWDLTERWRNLFAVDARRDGGSARGAAINDPMCQRLHL